ncbi:uncharacterized protein LOC116927628 [Daphnia magna]|nr:uncharacterized protein LOC116927628 [Daphnia magna]
MIKLTEEMVVARTRISDLSSVKKLNCWGADLQDVSLLRRMPNVEVLALSVNQIKSLADFQNCYQLQELYIRKNNIKDLRDVCYLRGLSSLRNLWLADNPCSQEDGYRFAVLRALPRLEKLDDVPIKPEEMEEAARKGRELVLPNKEDENYENNDLPQNTNDLVTIDMTVSKEPITRRSSEVLIAPTNHSIKSSPVTPSPELLETSESPSTPEEMHVIQPVHEEINVRRFSVIATGVSPQQEKPAQSESAPASRRSSVAAVSSFSVAPDHIPLNTLHFHAEQYSPSKCPIHQNTPIMPAPTTPTMQATSMSQLDLHNATSINESRNNFVDQRPFRIAQENPLPRYSPSNYQPTGYGPQNPPMSSYNMTPLPGQNSERCSPTRSSGRVRNRASNLLMAALCLVNELDYGSLEVLGMAVRNRLDEFDSN